MNGNESIALKNDFSLTDSNNYFEIIRNSSEDVMKKYHELIIEFLLVFTENKTLSLKNQEIYKFILFRGIQTISHVFYFILLYSKNLDLSYYHAIKSLHIYIEFIEQIMDDRHTFLKLYSKDAILFVYKKTIYDIPFHSVKQDISLILQKNDSLFMDDIFSQIEVIQDFIFLLLNEENEKIGAKFVFQIKELFTHFSDKQYKKLLTKDVLHFFLKNNFAEIYFFHLSFEKKKEQSNNKTEIICYLFECFLTKISKIKVFDLSKKEKVLEKRFKTKHEMNTPEDYISWLFSL